MVSRFRRQSGNKQTHGGDCITFLANAVGNKWINRQMQKNRVDYNTFLAKAAGSNESKWLQ